MNLWPWFSLTREFPAPSTDYDWPPYQPDRAVPTRARSGGIAQAGIDFVRLPVDPGPLLAFSGERRKRLMDDVFAAVELALSEDLSVLLNLHPNNATHHWNTQNLVGDVDGAAVHPLSRPRARHRGAARRASIPRASRSSR